MEIVYYGNACFSIKSKTANICIDPFKECKGLKGPKNVKADLVFSSNNTPEHSDTSVVSGDFTLVDWPGEYDIKDVIIEGFEQEGTTMFMMTVDGVNICHLGPISKIPKADILESLQSVDILLIPVGGGEVLSPKVAREFVDKIEPRVTIPMMFSQDGTPEGLASVDEFIKEMGIQKEEQDSLKIDKGKLPQDQSIVVTLNKK